MKTRTELSLSQHPRLISEGESLVAVGSCFAEVVARNLSERWIDTLCNPLGEMYNPLSVADTLDRVARCELFGTEHLDHRDDLWFLYQTSDLLAGVSPEEVVARANHLVVAAHEALSKAQWVVLTLGTINVYERDGRVVANCHKMAQSNFVRRALSVEEIEERLVELVEGTLAGKRVIISVSPVRHLGDGIVDNSLSKATLRVAVDRVVKRCNSVVYFPAYEIMLDDLRDYRYYADDMAHPSAQAEEYVWDKFAEAFVEPQLLAQGEHYRKLLMMASHRPLHPESAAWERHCATVRAKASELLAIRPTAKLEELASFGIE